MRYVRELKVGDRVTIRWAGIEGFATVSDVGKLKIKTDDGQEWKMTGYRWGSASYSGPWISPYKQTDEADLEEQRNELARRSIARRLEGARWRDMPMSVLQSVEALLKERKA